ncbi:MAG: hypothetical protein ACPG49_08895 [Chitinophagales bacterium]
MDLSLKEIATGETYEGQILESIPKKMPFKKDGWNFAWKKLAQTNTESLFFKLSLKNSPKIIEGLLTLVNDEMVYMDNVELAPHNYGSKGKYDHVAGSLIAFACNKSFELGEGHYVGFLSFDSKTQLISLYQEKYGAKMAIGRKMYIDNQTGTELIQKYLTITPTIKNQDKQPKDE